MKRSFVFIFAIAALTFKHQYVCSQIDSAIEQNQDTKISQTHESIDTQQMDSVVLHNERGIQSGSLLSIIKDLFCSNTDEEKALVSFLHHKSCDASYFFEILQQYCKKDTHVFDISQYQLGAIDMSDVLCSLYQQLCYFTKTKQYCLFYHSQLQNSMLVVCAQNKSISYYDVDKDQYAQYDCDGEISLIFNETEKLNQLQVRDDCNDYRDIERYVNNVINKEKLYKFKNYIAILSALGFVITISQSDLYNKFTYRQLFYLWVFGYLNYRIHK